MKKTRKMLISIHSKLLLIKNPIMNLYYSIIRIYPNLKKVYYDKFIDINDFINNELNQYLIPLLSKLGYIIYS